MTELHTISTNHISLECRCGHRSMLSISNLLMKVRPTMTVHQLASKDRCKQCGALGTVDFRLHWVCKTQEEYLGDDA
jgi:hypothetical protein